MTTKATIKRLLPSKVYWGIYTVAFVAMLVFWIKGQFGSDFSGVIAVLCYPVGVWYVVMGQKSRFQEEDEKALHDLVHTPDYTDGRAKWADNKDVAQADMTGGDGLFLGRLNGQNIYYPGETHLLTIVPPGAGKGTSIVIPNLLTYKGSVIVTDPKGELYAIRHRHQGCNRPR